MDPRQPAPDRPGDGFDVAPASLVARGRQPLRTLSVIVVVTGLAALIAKPWGEAERAVLPAPQSDPVPATVPRDPSPAPTGRNYRVEPISPAIAAHASGWGVATGAWWPSSDVPWTRWVPAGSLGAPKVPSPKFPSPEFAAPSPAPIDCGRALDLPTGIFIAVTGPAVTLANARIAIVAVAATGAELPVAVDRITAPADGETAYLFRRDPGSWPMGSYRVRVERGATPRSADVCLRPATSPSSRIPRALLEWGRRVARSDDGPMPEGSPASGGTPIGPGG